MAAGAELTKKKTTLAIIKSDSFFFFQQSHCCCCCHFYFRSFVAKMRRPSIDSSRFRWLAVGQWRTSLLLLLLLLLPSSTNGKQAVEGLDRQKGDRGPLPCSLLAKSTAIFSRCCCRRPPIGGERTAVRLWRPKSSDDRCTF